MNVWRFCKDIISSKSNLVKRRITTDSRCVLCGSEGETGIHILRNYLFVAYVWSLLILGCLPNGNLSPTVDEILCFGLANMILLMSWSLALSPGGKFSNSSLLLLLPFALNVDGVWNANRLVGNRLIGGMGVVLRDSVGNFLAGLSKSLPYSLVLASSKGFQNIVIESDSLQITQALCASSLDLSHIGLIVEGSKKISSGITGVCFTHIRRQANKVAHKLTRYSLSSTSPGLWFEESPNFILDVLLEDCLSEV
ncbi:hypothetical protein D8674_003105 [Pyrus ussuriensis x Pyrus communis]|uniref:RNase H type-1 domain-containing protein n=1 Tax=Pyrus ussuriensis x Pyrus communis TaxID=2448454 RepID=A0A5N5FLD8_9ROSA|nr:hypothetical protein D8674_003105 [Pyrus ussuriensis x Pyrus communis]